VTSVRSATTGSRTVWNVTVTFLVLSGTNVTLMCVTVMIAASVPARYCHASCYLTSLPVLETRSVGQIDKILTCCS